MPNTYRLNYTVNEINDFLSQINKAQGITENSINFNSSKAGCKAYYIKAIDKENKKIYLTDNQVLPVFTTENLIDINFTTPPYQKNDFIYIINGNHFCFELFVDRVEYNCVVFSGELGFDTFPYPDTTDQINKDDFTFSVPNWPEIGVVEIGTNAFALGQQTIASGKNSHAEGYYTKAIGENQHVQGKYNVEDASYAHIVGNGTDNGNRSNAHTLDWEGNAWYAGEVASSKLKIGNTVFTEQQLIKILNFIETIEGTNN